MVWMCMALSHGVLWPVQVSQVKAHVLTGDCPGKGPGKAKKKTKAAVPPPTSKPSTTETKIVYEKAAAKKDFKEEEVCAGAGPHWIGPVDQKYHQNAVEGGGGGHPLCTTSCGWPWRAQQGFFRIIKNQGGGLPQNPLPPPRPK